MIVSTTMNDDPDDEPPTSVRRRNSGNRKITWRQPLDRTALLTTNLTHLSPMTRLPRTTRLMSQPGRPEADKYLSLNTRQSIHMNPKDNLLISTRLSLFETRLRHDASNNNIFTWFPDKTDRSQGLSNDAIMFSSQTSLLRNMMSTHSGLAVRWQRQVSRPTAQGVVCARAWGPAAHSTSQ